MKAVVRPFEDEDLPGVDAMRPLAYPLFPEARDAEFHHRAYDWLRSHPLAADGFHRWVVDAGGRIVGNLTALPQYYRVGGKRVAAHTPADFMVLPEYGFQALTIMRRFFRTVENCVACDQIPEPMIVEKRLGAYEVGKLNYAAKLLDPSRLTRLPSSIPRQLPQLLTRGLRTADKALGAAFGGDHEAQVLDGFDAAFDDFFEEVAAAMPCIPEKDAAFLKWRYGPGAPLHPVTVLGVREGGRLLGYAVLRVPKKSGDGLLLDLTTLPGRRDVARSLVRGAVEHFSRLGAYLIRYRFVESPTSPRKGDLWPLGFFSREKRSNTLLVKFSDPGVQALASNLGNWSYSIGDGEASFWVG